MCRSEREDLWTCVIGVDLWLESIHLLQKARALIAFVAKKLSAWLIASVSCCNFIFLIGWSESILLYGYLVFAQADLWCSRLILIWRSHGASRVSSIVAWSVQFWSGVPFWSSVPSHSESESKPHVSCNFWTSMSFSQHLAPFVWFVAVPWAVIHRSLADGDDCIDCCCLFHSIRNSLVALLEALLARKNEFDCGHAEPHPHCPMLHETNCTYMRIKDIFRHGLSKLYAAVVNYI